MGHKDLIGADGDCAAGLGWSFTADNGAVLTASSMRTECSNAVSNAEKREGNNEKSTKLSVDSLMEKKVVLLDQPPLPAGSLGLADVNEHQGSSSQKSKERACKSYRCYTSPKSYKSHKSHKSHRSPKSLNNCILPGWEIGSPRRTKYLHCKPAKPIMKAHAISRIQNSSPASPRQKLAQLHSVHTSIISHEQSCCINHVPTGGVSDLAAGFFIEADTIGSFSQGIRRERVDTRKEKLMMQNMLEQTRTLSAPHEVRAAVGVQILANLGVCSPLFRTLCNELLKKIFPCIYTKYDARRAPFAAFFAGRVNPSEAVTLLSNEESYFAIYRRLVNRRSALKEEIKMSQQLENMMKSEILKKQAILKHTTRLWNNTLMASTFRVWKQHVATKKKQRNIMDACFERVSRNRAKEILRAWSQVARSLRREWDLEQKYIQQSRYKELELQMVALKDNIRGTDKQAYVWMQKLADLDIILKELSSQIKDKHDKVGSLTGKGLETEHNATEWFGFNNELISLELSLLLKQVEEQRAVPLVDPEFLVDEATQLDCLADMPVEELLTRWIGFHIPGIRWQEKEEVVWILTMVNIL